MVLMRNMYHVPMRCVIEETIVLEGESRQMSNINYLKGFLVFMLHFFFLRLNFRDLSLAIAIATSSSRFLFFQIGKSSPCLEPDCKLPDLEFPTVSSKT